jgi:hypothetical protein
MVARGPQPENAARIGSAEPKRISSVSRDLPMPPNPLTTASPDAVVPLMMALSPACSAE